MIPVGSDTAERVVPSSPSLPLPRTGPAAAPSGPRRRALDGLRAVAVVLVVVYHFGGDSSNILPGGFLGVDIFFVLSGYLITGILLDNFMITGCRGLAMFWYRRVRRLLPPLLLLCVLTIVAVWWAAPPESWPERRTDVLWVLLYAGNWRFLAERAASGPQLYQPPLAHTWSLAVEEQFYLVWPLLLMSAVTLGRRVAGRRVALGLAAMVAGLGIVVSAVWTARAYAAVGVEVYFSTWGRVQELLAGALLALAAPAVFRRLEGSMGRRAGLAGWVVLGCAVATTTFTSPWYYHGGFLLVSAAVVVILVGLEAGHGGIAVRILEWRPVVALGRVSYGVYLYHHLLLVAVPLHDGVGASTLLDVQLIRVSASLGLAVLSYVALERPLLSGTMPWIGTSPRRLVPVLMAGGLATAALSVAATSLPGDVDVQLGATPPPACLGETPQGPKSCPLSAGAGSGPTWIVTGDATALSLAAPLSQVGRTERFQVVQAAWPRCDGPWAAGGGPGRATESRACGARAPKVIAAALSAGERPLVVVAAGLAGRGGPGPDPAADRLTRDALLALVDTDAAHGARTLFVEQPSPSLGLGTLVASGRPAGSRRPDDSGTDAVRRYDEVLREVASLRPKIAAVVSVADVVCPHATCPPVIDGVLVRMGDGSYTPRFARRLADVLAARAEWMMIRLR